MIEESNIPNMGRIYPIYSELYGIKPGWFTEKIRTCIEKTNTIFDEYLPKDFLKKYNLL
jgi:RecG-like helicase